MKRIKLAISDVDPSMSWTPWGPVPVASTKVFANDPGDVLELSIMTGPAPRKFGLEDFMRRNYFAAGKINSNGALGDFLRRGFSTAKTGSQKRFSA